MFKKRIYACATGGDADLPWTYDRPTDRTNWGEREFKFSGFLPTFNIKVDFLTKWRPLKQKVIFFNFPLVRAREYNQGYYTFRRYKLQLIRQPFFELKNEGNLSTSSREIQTARNHFRVTLYTLEGCKIKKDKSKILIQRSLTISLSHILNFERCVMPSSIPSVWSQEKHSLYKNHLRVCQHSSRISHLSACQKADFYLSIFFLMRRYFWNDIKKAKIQGWRVKRFKIAQKSESVERLFLSYAFFGGGGGSLKLFLLC